MRVSLIVAAAANNVIGADGGLAWHLPDDFAWFKRITMGKPVIMGRRTWESIGRPLPGRRNIVVTRADDYRADGAVVVDSPGAALALIDNEEEAMVIGGGQIYAEFLGHASRIYLTRVDVDVEGDTEFAPLDDRHWVLESTEPHAADDRHAYAFEFCVYVRRDHGGTREASGQ